MLGPILVGLLGLVQPSGIPDFKPPEFADARRLYFSGQFREAGERFRATDRAYRARFGHPAPIYLGYLGLCHQALGEYDEAEAIFGEALAVIERLEGIPEPLADMLVNLATIRALRRDHPEALRLFDRALALLDRADANNRPGERWWLTGRIHARRAQSLITLGRHGEARRILTEMLGRRSQFRDRMANFRDRSQIVLSIADDGQGFDTAHVHSATGGGNGLPNMRKRAAELGATLTITSEVGKVTRIDLRFVPDGRSKSLDAMTDPPTASE